MKPSCNGCRILRKGCNDDCAIRPCLEWIKSPDSQANATLFLAKFYGRTGLLNLITAAPQNQGPAVFRSLLYEACGRVVNPINGSMGLIWTGEWARCQAAVDAVLTGSRINDVPVSDWRAAGTLDFDHILPAGNIRHVARATGLSNMGDRTRFKRTGNVIKPQPRVGSVDSIALWGLGSDSAETVEASLLSQDEPNRAGQTGVNLELSLGFDCQSACDKRRCY